MKIIPQFKGIIDFLSVTKRTISDSQVSQINREDRRKFKKIKSFPIIKTFKKKYDLTGTWESNGSFTYKILIFKHLF